MSAGLDIRFKVAFGDSKLHQQISHLNQANDRDNESRETFPISRDYENTTRSICDLSICSTAQLKPKREIHWIVI